MANRRAAEIPARISGEGHCYIWQADACQFIAVIIDLWDQNWKGMRSRVGKISTVTGWDAERRADAWNGWEYDLVARYQCPVNEPRMCARWRFDILANPTVEGDQKRSLRETVLVAIRLLRARALRRQITAGYVLGAGEEINPNVFRLLDVVAAVESGVYQCSRTSTAPVFTR